ncbi:FMN reductase [Rhodococcus rhodochrous J3]|uniref:FMN reductase n=3 Tax=Rhodococcus rhodochrous TaxID=1829 RepID=A0AA47A849_RHORH|nr:MULTISPECIES: FMN reductase [Rhodococcus]AYA26689.1 oxidoreductase [Rhodococcus rhodochrous]MBF4476896.1 FMN reductase [Rhodococcus rhodochrous]MCB8908746.1 FMN reductase [Rhodococcus rhodochrous]MDJ0398371.1 FMN reductase [Rhodococcus rhodochrous]TWH36957.1 FMN reductase [Rhodococcus rhodochrous J38]
MTRRIVVVSGGLSEPSTTRLLADRIAEATRVAVGARGDDAEIEVIELRSLATDLATTFTAGVPTAAVARAREQLATADGLIAVSPVFAAGYSGLFKMFFDALDPDTLTGVPTVLAATAGSARHSLVLDHAMRPLLSYLRALVVPTGVFATTDDFGTGEAATALKGRIDRAADELAEQITRSTGSPHGFSDAVPAGRPRVSGNAVRTDGPSFRELLGAHMG